MNSLQDKAQSSSTKKEVWQPRGVKGLTTKYVRGSCTNCGATNHSIKECCDRPREVPVEHTLRTEKLTINLEATPVTKVPKLSTNFKSLKLLKEQHKAIQLVDDVPEKSDNPNSKKQPAKSKYVEDVIIGEHTTVWGSWWNETLGWGFGCCHQNSKIETCLGVKGKKLAQMKEYDLRKEQQAENIKDLQIEELPVSEVPAEAIVQQENNELNVLQ